MKRWIFNQRFVWHMLGWFGWGVCFVWDEDGVETGYLCRDVQSLDQGWRIY